MPCGVHRAVVALTAPYRNAGGASHSYNRRVDICGADGDVGVRRVHREDHINAPGAAECRVIAAGILTWIAACRPANHGLLFLAGLFLVSLGTAGTVWT